MLIISALTLFICKNFINASTIEDYSTEKPVIGVLSQPSSWTKIFDPADYSYIATSYVKYLESAGARVVPIRYNMDRQSLIKLLGKLNGVLLPGGGADLWDVSSGITDETSYTELMKVGKFIIDYAIEQNDHGNYYPIWGTCLGFEILLLAAASDVKTFSYVNSTNWSQRLKYLNVSINDLIADFHKISNIRRNARPNESLSFSRTCSLLQS